MKKQEKNNLYEFAGIIVAGDAIGRGFGCPTANVDIGKDELHMEEGVYACRATVNNNTYDGALAVKEKPWKVEVHLMNFPDRDIYGENLSVVVVQKVSDMIKLKTDEDLMDKIAEDLRLVRMALHG